MKNDLPVDIKMGKVKKTGITALSPFAGNILRGSALQVLLRLLF